nr:M1 family aminopeptidase [Maribacter sp. Hal144]
MAFLEDYTAYPFPFQKLDYAAIPGFQYGGMEHVGAIQYREGALFLDESATENQRLSRAKLIAHETAHMWFGDLVTMDWFSDVWMKEVFANFMADKIVNPVFPDINHDLAFMVTHYPRAYGEDRTLGTNPIRQNLENLNDAGSLYGSIIYNKAPIMMRQLETIMGTASFQKGIQAYIKEYEYGNAVWNDLVELLDKETKTDLKKWSEIWVNRSSRPLFQEKITYNDDGTIDTFELMQEAEDGSDGIWPQTFDISMVYSDSVHKLTATVSKPKNAIENAAGLKKPKAIIYNSNGLGYGVFPIDTENLDAILDIEDEVARGYTYINAYENALNGNLAAETLFNLYQKSLLSEKNELLVNLISGYLNMLFWTYLTEAQQEKHQSNLENQLIRQLQSDLPPNIKKILFGSFQSIAYSDSGNETLYKIWNKSIIIPDLKLNEDDYTRMAMTLALFEHPDTTEILEIAKKNISNPDKRERFEFLLPSLSNEPAIRNAFFESLKDAENREKENWTLSALNYLNHPLRHRETIQYLKPSLELLDEIQKTGDIFFPKGWLNNTIGKYNSPESYQILQKFIEANPDLNPALLKKLLQASDDLRRMQLLRKKVDVSNN